ncbi:hypothetical protein HN385_03940 [archaeon]|jgi:hypothetical protein|nr:hypothetical protein [archaeon]MBT3450900.1 hypothetical protein [archaeon]MBT6869082.1 hypothetical protein [archaeon]MBT7193325.1 hypothetical protein [archaeon]MBT7380333.1 hypothetical protein [archaeon]
MVKNIFGEEDSQFRSEGTRKLFRTYHRYFLDEDKQRDKSPNSSNSNSSYNNDNNDDNVEFIEKNQENDQKNNEQNGLEDNLSIETTVRKKRKKFIRPQALEIEVEQTNELHTPTEFEEVPTGTYQFGENIFNEILDYYKANIIGGIKSTPILEEDSNCLLSTICASSRNSFIVEGESRTGKSLIVDKLTPLLTSVYYLRNCSNKSMFGNSEQINKNDFLYITEFQSAIEGNPAVKEALKLITEDKDASNDGYGERVTLNGDITVMSTGADENIKTQRRDVELSGRFIILKTRADAEKIKAICDYQDGLLDGSIEGVNFSKDRLRKLKKHIVDTINLKDVNFENPFVSSYSQHLPNTKKSVYYRTLYYSLVNAFTKIDRHNRVWKGEDKLITNIQDIYITHQLYHQNYCNILKNLSLQSYSSMEKSLTTLEKDVKKQEMENEIKLIDNLISKPVDWEQVWDSGYKIMKERNFDLAEQWKINQSLGDSVLVYDPIIKQQIGI